MFLSFHVRFFSSLYLCSLFLCTGAAMKNHPIITVFGTERRGLTAYVLTEDEMIKNNYPVKGKNFSLCNIVSTKSWHNITNITFGNKKKSWNKRWEGSFFCRCIFLMLSWPSNKKEKKNRCSYWDQSQLFLFSILFFNCHLASSCFYLTLFYSQGAFYYKP